jgi:nucleoside-diphosphate-sugar epimerase
VTTLVTGATGFIGSHVSRLLSDTGRQPRMMFRRRKRAELLSELDGELVIADLGSPPSLRRAAQGAQSVIHLAGRATFEPYSVVAPTLVEGTRAMAEAAVEAGVETFVFSSSALVYPSAKTPIDADTPVDPEIGYGRAKIEAEQILTEIGSSTDMRVVFPRLPHVYGADSILFGYIERGLVPFPGDMDATYSHLHVDDAARALVAAVDGGVEGPLPIADNSPVEWQRFFDTVQVYDPELRVVDLPGAVLERALRLVEPLRRHRRPSMATPDAIHAWLMNQKIDAEQSWKLLGIQPIHESIATGIPAALETTLPEAWRHSLSDRRR